MKDFNELYRINGLPVFQNRMYPSREDARNCPKGDVTLVEDLETGLVFNRSFVPELVRYDEHYQNEQANSSAFRTHLVEVATIVEKHMGRASIAEIGCGKGYFLELLTRQGFDVIGFDPTYEGSNPRIEKRYFSGEVGLRAQGLVLRHVLEHVTDPVAFLELLRDANGGGIIYIEVPCFEWICEHRAWFDVFYEHANYFRPSDFVRMFGEVRQMGHLFGGQYLYVVADLAHLRRPTYDAADHVRFPSDFLRSLEIPPTVLAGAPTVVWGGASKGVIFSILRERAGSPVDLVIDINPAKQGKFLPGTGLLVRSPEEALPSVPKGSPVFIMNSNYLEEIRELSANSFNYIGLDA